MVTKKQIRAALAVLPMTVEELARGVNRQRNTISIFLNTPGSSMRSANLKAIKTYLESQGIVFEDDNGIRWTNDDNE